MSKEIKLGLNQLLSVKTKTMATFFSKVFAPDCQGTGKFVDCRSSSQCENPPGPQTGTKGHMAI